MIAGSQYLFVLVAVDNLKRLEQLPRDDVMRRFLPLLFFLSLISIGSRAVAEPFVLAYPERSRLPLMAESPNDEGIYRDIFTRAVSLLGAELTILRLPKKRLFQYMRDGRVDAYPGSFSGDRVAFMNWIDFGVMTREICITRNDVPPLTDLAQAPPMRVVHEIGDSRAEIDKKYPNLTPVVFGVRLDVEQGLSLVKGRRGDLFLIEELPLRYYLTRNAAPSLAALGLRAHLDCIAGEKPLLLGISRSSKWYAERPNPIFTRSRALAPDNLPMQIDESFRA